MQNMDLVHSSMALAALMSYNNLGPYFAIMDRYEGYCWRFVYICALFTIFGPKNGASGPNFRKLLLF